MIIDKDKSCVEAYLNEYAMMFPDRTAIIVKDEMTTYSKLREYVWGFAGYLRDRAGLKKSDCVVVRSTQTLSYAVSYFAVHLCGGIFVPVERSLPDDKCVSIIQETNAVIYIAPKEINGLEMDGIQFIQSKNVESISKDHYVEGKLFDFPALSDSADIMYTTGTTGKAKGVEITHSVILATAENYITGFKIKPENVIAVPGPMNHVNPLRKLYVSIMNGSTIVILNGMLNIRNFYHALDEQGVTSLCLPPASLRTLWQVSGNKLSEYAEKIDFVECSTAPLTEDDKSRLRSQLPYSRLYNNYGLSECGAMLMYDFNEYKEKTEGCVGTPAINAHVIIVDDNRNEIQSSKENTGFIACEGPINMKGYWREPELTARTKDDRFVYTNDLAYYDEDGFVHIVGRKDDTINIGGLKVSPTEVEDAAQSMDGISECICVPVDDELTGSALKLFVVPREGYVFDETAIRKYMIQHVESCMVPKYIDQIAKIPRNYVGKPDRKVFQNGILRK